MYVVLISSERVSVSVITYVVLNELYWLCFFCIEHYTYSVQNRYSRKAHNG
jgi:hypothetical protein